MAQLRYNVTSEVKVEFDYHFRIFSALTFVTIIVSIVLILVLLFPGKQLLTALVNQNYISEVDYFYSLLLRKQSDPDALTYPAIQRDPSRAFEQLNQLLPQLVASNNLDQLWINYIILKSITFNSSLPKPLKIEGKQIMMNYLNQFKTLNNSNQQLMQLGDDSLAIEQSPIALFFYEQLLERNKNEPLYFYTRVAEVALWAKECNKSADLYFYAMDRSTSMVDKRFFYFAALKTLLQCDKSQLAVDLAEKHIDGLKDDIQTYELLVQLAIQADKPNIAEQFMIRLLELKSMN